MPECIRINDKDDQMILQCSLYLIDKNQFTNLFIKNKMERTNSYKTKKYWKFNKLLQYMQKSNIRQAIFIITLESFILTSMLIEL